VAELQKAPEVRKDWEACKLYAKCFEQEQNAGLNPGKLGALIRAFQDLATRFPDTRWGVKAAGDIKRLNR